MIPQALVDALWAAFDAECTAYMKYTLFAAAARREGYQEIAAALAQTAVNEQAHARAWLTAVGAYPDGKTPGDTLKNLLDAAETEHREWAEDYKRCAEQARQAGDAGLATKFDQVAAIEATHEKRFRALAQQLQEGTLLAAPGQPQTVWVCRNCGHVHLGDQPPEICPVCEHPKGFFQRPPIRE